MVPGALGSSGPAAVVLASASPRRRELLAALGLDFEVVVPEVEELAAGPPERVVAANAERKCRAVAARWPRTWVIGCDTEVAIDGRTLGKPESREGARERLGMLAGRTHAVLGGWAVATPGGELRGGVERTEVTFREPDEMRLAAYLDSGEWRGRAGAYAVQGLGSILVERVEGDLANVIGLPIRGLIAAVPELFGGATAD